MTIAEPIRAAHGGDAKGVVDSSRFVSVDVLRGFVIFTMLFVNDIAGAKSAPWWMKHYHPEDANGMTFVDLVFPAFLFIVGVSIPLAMGRRVRRGEARWRLVGHVVVRTLSLLLLGLLTVNAPGDGKRMGLPAGLWALLAYTFGTLAFVSVGTKVRGARALVMGVRLASLMMVGYLISIYRDADGGKFQTSWWGILGLIGWAYLVASLVYLTVGRWLVLLAVMVPVLAFMFYMDRMGWFDRVWVNEYVDFGTMLGSQASITTAGAVLGAVLMRGWSLGRKILFALGFGVVLAVGGMVTYSHGGINKNNATPSWCFWASAITCWLWILFGLATDVARFGKWVGLLVNGGGAALMAYMLVAIWYKAIEVGGWSFYWKMAQGGLAPALARSLVAATVFLWVAGALKRIGVQLRL
jgi:predicted acyltransferase